MGDYEWVSSSKRTLVLVGRTGNGKSTTGNSILGKNAFKSARQSSGVTETCELQEATMKDGLAVAVIDTPGLFDSDAKSNINIGKEIVKCIDLARDDGIDAVLVVLSTASRFSDEEDATIRTLEKLFVNRIYNYMILVFTGGDDIPSLPHYLGSSCPEKLKKFISLCRRRVVLFDNKTNDENKKAQQVGELLLLVDDVLLQNGGQPFTNLKDATGEIEVVDEKQLVEEQAGCSREAQLKLNDEIEKVRDDLEKASRKLEQQLAEEQAQRLMAEKISEEAQMEFNGEMEKLEKNWEKATHELEEKLIHECYVRRRKENRLEYAQLKTGDDIENLLRNLGKLNEATGELEKRLAEEEAGRLRAEEISQQAQMKLNDEIKNLRENLGQATRELEMYGKCFSSRKGPKKKKTTFEKLL